MINPIKTQNIILIVVSRGHLIFPVIMEIKEVNPDILAIHIKTI